VVAHFLPGLADFADVLITWGIGAALLALGTALGGGGAAAEYRLAAGWGGLCLVLTLWGVFVPISLRVPLIAVLVGMAALLLATARRAGGADWRGLGRLLAVSLPLWAVMAPIRPSQIDSFLNLLPNAFYLVDYARLPTVWLPPSFSFLPAAPYNTQFLAFLGSLADPGFPASGMSLVNVLLMLIGGLAIARTLAARPAGAEAGWGIAALGLLLATLLNPGFVPRFDFSSYGETALMVTAVLAACLLAAGQGALAAAQRPRRLVELSLILVAMINAKQSAFGLVAALAAAAVVVGAAERAVQRRALLGLTALALLPAALTIAVWRYYVAHAGVAELTNLPVAEWNWLTLPQTLRAIADSIAEKPVFFAVVALALAAFPVLLRRQGWTPATRLLGLNAALFVFYNLFLLTAYIAHFDPEGSREAHSYFRYNTHLSLVLVLAVALAAREFGAARWLAAHRPAASGAAIVLALLAPIGFAERLRFDLPMPQPYVWQLARHLKPYLHDGDRVALLFPGDDGSIADMMAGYLGEAPPRRRGLRTMHDDRDDASALAAAAAAGYDLVVIGCTPAGLLQLPAGEGALVRHAADGWHAVASWPYPRDEWVTRWQRARHWPAVCR
jgi:hypothetical protein